MTGNPHRVGAGLACALIAATFYGLNIPYARLASFAGVSGATLVFYRVLLMLAVVLAFVLVTRRSIAVAPSERATVVVLGLVTTLVGICYISSVSFVPVAVAVALFYTFPVVIVLASPLVEGTRLTPFLLGNAVLALIGVALVVGPAFHALDWRGIALALGASIAAAMQFFAMGRSRRTGTVAKVFWVHIFVLPASAVIGLVTATLTGPATLALEPLGVGMTLAGYVLGFTLHLMALVRIPAVMAGIAFCLEPVVAAFASTLILGEGIEPVQLFGGGLVIAAIIANVLRENQTPRSGDLAMADSPQ
ncbi:EamA family transporter [Microvirga massiliensis]|uniref:EamA family transporter n=1 Tax=Microvirga massiliensis TaxID=1033741 RepID=UPI0009E293F5|nr:DMT family transporter [Microvirga massiliensis]